MTKKTFVPLLGAIALLASCAENEIVDKGAIPSSDLISFGTYMKPSGRAAAVGSLDELKTKNFKVFAAYTGTNTWGATTDKTPNFMYNDAVTWDVTAAAGNGAWTYTGAKYWPQSGNVTFYAYSPNLSTNLVHSLATMTADPSFTYTVPNDVDAQEDLLADIVADKTKADGIVKFNFDHLLSKVGFAAKLNANYTGATVKVTKMQITYGTDAIKNKATYTYAEDNTVAGIWTAAEGAMSGSNELQPTEGVLLNSTTSSDLNDTDKYLMMLPQTTTAAALKARIEYEVSYTDGVKTENVATIDLPECSWLPGKQYTYNFNISLSAVTFDVIAVNPWEDAQTVDMKDEEGKIILAGSETNALFTDAIGGINNQVSYTTAVNATFISVEKQGGGSLQYFDCSYDGLSRSTTPTLVFTPKNANTNPTAIEETAIVTFKDILGNTQAYTFKLKQSGKLSASFGGSEIANNAKLLFKSTGDAYSCDGNTTGISGQTITLNISGATNVSVTGNSSFTCTPADDKSSITITAPIGILTAGANNIEENISIVLTEDSNIKTYSVTLKKCAPAALMNGSNVISNNNPISLQFKSTKKLKTGEEEATSYSCIVKNASYTTGSTLTTTSDFNVTLTTTQLIIAAANELRTPSVNLANKSIVGSDNIMLKNACNEETKYSVTATQYAIAYILGTTPNKDDNKVYAIPLQGNRFQWISKDQKRTFKVFNGTTVWKGSWTDTGVGGGIKPDPNKFGNPVLSDNNTLITIGNSNGFISGQWYEKETQFTSTNTIGEAYTETLQIGRYYDYR